VKSVRGRAADLLGHDAALEELRRRTMKPLGAMKAETPVLAARTTLTRCSPRERVHREVLLGPARASEPCVVRHVTITARRPHELPEEIGKMPS